MTGVVLMRFPDRLAALVVIPAFNAGAFIVRTLESARESIVLHCRRRGRAVEDFLLVVVDDASTDDTGSVVEKWGEETGFPVLLIRNPVNLGTSASRNRGAAAASSRYVFFLDHDDEFLAEHVDLCLSALDTKAEIAFVRTRVEMMAPVHPDWAPIISSHLPITFCRPIKLFHRTTRSGACVVADAGYLNEHGTEAFALSGQGSG